MHVAFITVHDMFGFGYVDADKATKLAQTWKTVDDLVVDNVHFYIGRHRRYGKHNGFLYLINS